MHLWELIIIAVGNLRGNKPRSFLTILGIVIGIAAVILVVGVGQGGRSALMQEMENFGTNIFTIGVDKQDQSIQERSLELTDIEAIKRLTPEVKYLAPLSYSQMNLRGTRGQQAVMIIGTTADYAGVRNLARRWGRFINEDDDQIGRRIIVLEEDTANKLFGPGNPVGQQLMINNDSAVVAGVLKKDVSSMGFDSGEVAYVPISFMFNMTGWRAVNQIYGSATSREQVNTAMEKCKRFLERRHNAPGHYITYSMEQDMQSANKITAIIELIISFIAGISLLVGGIGVMNIMLVSVAERTREIGIRMALGAERKDIIAQFLIESIVLCLLGGMIGIVLGHGGALIVAKIAKWPPVFSWSTIMIAFGFSTCIGLFFGIYPANKASRLKPIDALRRD